MNYHNLTKPRSFGKPQWSGPLKLDLTFMYCKRGPFLQNWSPSQNPMFVEKNSRFSGTNFVIFWTYKQTKKRKYMSETNTTKTSVCAPLVKPYKIVLHFALWPLVSEVLKNKKIPACTTDGWVDQLWTKGICSSHPWPLLGKVKTAGQGCGFRASSGRSLEWHLKPWDSQLTVLSR